MRIINILKDGSTRSSMEGVVVRSKDFYRVIKSIKEKQGNNSKTN